MVAWVVMNRQQPRQTPPSFFPAPIPILGLTPPSSQEKLPLCFHTLAWNPFYNPFVFKFMHVMGGGAPPPRDPDCLSPTPCPLLVPSKAEGSPFFSHSCAIFCTFLHSRKSQLFSFQAIPHSLRKTTRGGGPSAVFAIAGEPRANAREQISRTP